MMMCEQTVALARLLWQQYLDRLVFFYPKINMSCMHVAIQHKKKANGLALQLLCCCAADCCSGNFDVLFGNAVAFKE